MASKKQRGMTWRDLEAEAAQLDRAAAELPGAEPKPHQMAEALVQALHRAERLKGFAGWVAYLFQYVRIAALWYCLAGFGISFGVSLASGQWAIAVASYFLMDVAWGRARDAEEQMILRGFGRDSVKVPGLEWLRGRRAERPTSVVKGWVRRFGQRLVRSTEARDEAGL